jgi:ribonuclease PH
VSSESDPFERSTMDELLNLAFDGVEKIFEQQIKAVNEA